MSATLTMQQAKEWLASQLETATLSGGNEFLPGQHIEEFDMEGGEDNEIIVIPSDGPTVSFKVEVWGS